MASTAQQLKQLLIRDHNSYYNLRGRNLEGSFLHQGGLYSNGLEYKKILYTLVYKLSTILEEFPEGMCQSDRNLIRNVLDAILAVNKSPDMQHLLIKGDERSFMVGLFVKRLIHFYLNNTFSNKY